MKRKDRNYVSNVVEDLGYSESARSVEILRELIACPSINPEQVADPDGSDEQYCRELRLATLLAERFEKLGFTTILDDSGTEKGRPNMYATLANPASKRWCGLDIHTDTVAITGMPSPFGGELTLDGRLHGRGACDTKATFATLLALLEEAKARGQAPNCNLLVCGSVGEETGRLGADAFHNWLLKQGIVLDELAVAEPTGCRPIHGHKGHVRLKFEVEGRAAHSSIPEVGVNAIVGAAELVGALMEENRRLQALPPGPLGCATLTPTLVEGGTGINIVPPSAAVSIDRRVVAGEEASAVRQQLEELARAVGERSEHCVSLTPHGSGSEPEGNAFLEPASSPFVRRIAEWSGREAKVATYGTNAGLPYSTAAAKSVIVFGPGEIAQAHQADEWIHLSELRLHKQVLAAWLLGDAAGSK